ncbi:hypothetical protein [uncultured Nostoc sp.]|uniref:hypothetical protein n=1 Tax=uncultured Nostoc sp. TaxID=340711 RepID=UPI0035CC7C31
MILTQVASYSFERSPSGEESSSIFQTAIALWSNILARYLLYANAVIFSSKP